MRSSAVLSIAGHDPCGGAGVLADAKVFEQIGVRGMAVTTGITYQNETSFEGVDWLETEKVVKQINVLSKRYSFSHIKIGIVNGMTSLTEILKVIRNINEHAVIIWDPVLKTSSGFTLHHTLFNEDVEEALRLIGVITPNIDEAKVLSGIENSEEAGEKLAALTKVILKGGHGIGKFSDDILFDSGERYTIKGRRMKNISKHGSGCVFSAALTAYLSKNLPLYEAAVAAKEYTRQFLKSSTTLLGVHRDIKVQENAIAV